MNARLPRTSCQTTSRRTTLLASASALGIATVLSVSGCQWTSEIQTEKDYDPGDGVSVRVGEVQLRNVLVVSDKQGGSGTLAAWARNESDQPVTVTLAVGEGQKAELQLPARGAATLGQGGKPATVQSVPVAPGMLTEVTVSTPGGGSVVTRVPVMASQADSPYATMGPGGSAAPSAPASAPASAAAGH